MKKMFVQMIEIKDKTQSSLIGHQYYSYDIPLGSGGECIVLVYFLGCLLTDSHKRSPIHLKSILGQLEAKDKDYTS